MFWGSILLYFVLPSASSLQMRKAQQKADCSFEYQHSLWSHTSVTAHKKSPSGFFFFKHADYTTSPISQMFPLHFIINHISVTARTIGMSCCSHARFQSTVMTRLNNNLLNCSCSPRDHLESWNTNFDGSPPTRGAGIPQFYFYSVHLVFTRPSRPKRCLILFLRHPFPPLPVCWGRVKRMHLINVFITWSCWWMGTLCPFVSPILAL